MNKEYIITDRDFNILENILINSYKDNYMIILKFVLNNKISFLKKLKHFILNNNIDFKKVDFTNLNEFINFLLNKGIYLPRNINLFLIQPCFNGCSFCDKKYDFLNGYKYPLYPGKDYLSLESIKIFFDKYSPSKSTNINLSGEGDPLLHPEFKDIVLYLKNKGYHITLFLGGKSLLQFDVDFLDKNIDSFKLNVGASNLFYYNKTHHNKIDEIGFNKLKNIIKLLSNNHYINIVSVVNNNNFKDIYNQYKMCLDLGAKSFEIKVDHEFPKDSLLESKIMFDYYINLVKKIINEKKINICSDFRADLTKYVYIPEIEKSTILDDIYQDEINKGFDISKIERLNICKQFGHSMFLNYDGNIYICCIKQAGKAGVIKSDIPYHEQNIFIEKNILYERNTPKICKECPVRVDRVKNIFKYFYVKKL